MSLFLNKSILVIATGLVLSCTPKVNLSSLSRSADSEYLTALSFIEHILAYSRLDGANESSIDKISNDMKITYKDKTIAQSASLSSTNESKQADGMIALSGVVQEWLGINKSLADAEKIFIGSAPAALEYFAIYRRSKAAMVDFTTVLHRVFAENYKKYFSEKFAEGLRDAGDQLQKVAYASKIDLSAIDLLKAQILGTMSADLTDSQKIQGAKAMGEVAANTGNSYDQKDFLNAGLEALINSLVNAEASEENKKNVLAEFVTSFSDEAQSLANASELNSLLEDLESQLNKTLAQMEKQGHISSASVAAVKSDFQQSIVDAETTGISGLSVASDSGTTSISLTWTSGTDSLNGYFISYQSGATAPADCSTGTTSTSSTASATITVPTAHTAYSFRVCAGNSNSTPDESSGATVTALRPSPPNPINFTSSAVTTSGVTLDWDSNGGTTHTYKVAYAQGASYPSNCSSGTIVSSADNQEVITGLSPGTQYSFRVCALNNNPTPTMSAGTTGVQITTLNTPPEPTSFAATATSTSEINLTWVSGGGSTDSFRISYKVNSAPTSCTSDSTTTAISSATSKAISGLSEGVTYYFKICAVNSSAQESSAVSTSVATQGTAIEKFSETFTGANGTAIIGDTWQNAGSSILATIQSNAASLTSAGTHIFTTEIPFFDGTVTVDHTATGDFYGGIVFRFQDANNYWVLELDPNVTPTKLFLSKVQAGSSTTMASADYTYTPGSTYELKVTINGTSISGSYNGASVSTTSSFNQSMTRHGLKITKGSGTGNFDNFKFNTLTSSVANQNVCGYGWTYCSFFTASNTSDWTTYTPDAANGSNKWAHAASGSSSIASNKASLTSSDDDGNVDGRLLYDIGISSSVVSAKLNLGSQQFGHVSGLMSQYSNSTNFNLTRMYYENNSATCSINLVRYINGVADSTANVSQFYTTGNHQCAPNSIWFVTLTANGNSLTAEWSNGNVIYTLTATATSSLSGTKAGFLAAHSGSQSILATFDDFRAKAP